MLHARTGNHRLLDAGQQFSSSSESNIPSTSDPYQKRKSNNWKNRSNLYRLFGWKNVTIFVLVTYVISTWIWHEDHQSSRSHNQSDKSSIVASNDKRHPITQSDRNSWYGSTSSLLSYSHFNPLDKYRKWQSIKRYTQEHYNLIQRRPTMYFNKVDGKGPVLFFADAILAGQCVTLTSRYRGDGRPEYDLNKTTVRFVVDSESVADHNMHRMMFTANDVQVWKSNAKGMDTPVLQLKYCDNRLSNTMTVSMLVTYDNEPTQKVIIPRLALPKVTFASCTMSALKDLWSAHSWIEHHRNQGIQRFTIYINDRIPSPQELQSARQQSLYYQKYSANPKALTKSIDTAIKTLLWNTKTTGSIDLIASLVDLLSQPDVTVVEWPFPFKDPNTTRNLKKAPLHYARPLEWNSCNEREHHGANYTLFNDMDEYLVMDFAVDQLYALIPQYCKAAHIGQYWAKLKCPVHRDSLTANQPAFQSLDEMKRCQMFTGAELVFDSLRRSKMIVHTARDDIHDVLNHDLAEHIPPECRLIGTNGRAYQLHMLNLRPNNEHASAARFGSFQKKLEESSLAIDVHTALQPVEMKPSIKRPSNNNGNKYKEAREGLHTEDSEEDRIRVEAHIHDETQRKVSLHGRKVYLTLSTKPSRVRFIPKMLEYIDLDTYDVQVILNLPLSYGKQKELYQIPSEVINHPRITVHRISVDLGPITKVAPTLHALLVERERQGFAQAQLPPPVVISIDDDTLYPMDLVHRLLKAAEVVDYRAVVALCGVNVSAWSLDTACDFPNSKACGPFDVRIANTDRGYSVLLADHKDPRALTPIDVIKGFTGVIYPMDVLTSNIVDEMIALSELRALDVDFLRGFAPNACYLSDDYVISAALHKAGINRYRLSHTDDCREGLSQFEFGFRKDALQVSDGGHYAKYFVCARAIAWYLQTSPRVASTTFRTLQNLQVHEWIDRDFSGCRTPSVAKDEKVVIQTNVEESEGMMKLRWSKPWYDVSHKAWVPPKHCWTDTRYDSRWRCPFDISFPSQRPTPLYTTEGSRIFPIQYAFQHTRMPERLRPLEKDWSVIWPVQAKHRFDTNRGYSFATEEEYYREYGTSLFAYTYHKGGWDSMRHYEILANGGIPYFLELKRCPPNIMMRFPKTLIRDVMELPGVINTGKVDMRKANLSCLMDVRRKLFDYTRFNLSTVSLARYFLSAMGKPHAKSILMVNGRNQWDYLTDSLFHGLRLLLGSGVVDVFKRHFMYKNGRQQAFAGGFVEYGRGFSYAWALPDDDGDISRHHDDIVDRIRNHSFDLIVIGQLHNPIQGINDWDTFTNLSMHMFWPEIEQSYSKSDIAFLDGLDYHKRHQRRFLVKASRYGVPFVREIDHYVMTGEEQRHEPGSKMAEQIEKHFHRRIMKMRSKENITKSLEIAAHSLHVPFRPHRMKFPTD